MLVQLLMSLNWQSILVLHQQELDINFGGSLEASDISIVDYQIDSSTEEHLMTILRDVEKVFQSHLNLLLLCDVTTTILVLRQMSRFCGTRSNSSVDLCHVSRVLVVGTSDDLPVLLDSNIQVENVALLELPLRQRCATLPRIWTLMFQAKGRGFVEVDLSDVAAVTEVFPNVRFGYNGRQLTVIMKTHPLTYGYKNVNKRKVSSLSLHILQTMAENLNFSYKIIPAKENLLGKNENGSWTGIFGMLQRREADLSADHITIHADRNSVADFIMPPLFENERVVLYRKEEPDEDQLLVFLRPLQSYVLLLLGVSLVVSSILLFFLYGACLKQGSNRHSSHVPELILIAGWWKLATIISAVYCGTIVAIFAVKIEKPPFSNLAELAVREDYTIGYDPSTITENFLRAYTYLGMQVRNKLQNAQIQDKPRAEYKSGLKKIWSSELSARNKVKAINTFAVPVLSYSLGVVDWAEQDIQSLDRLTRRIMSDNRLLGTTSSAIVPPTSAGTGDTIGSVKTSPATVGNLRPSTSALCVNKGASSVSSPEISDASSIAEEEKSCAYNKDQPQELRRCPQIVLVKFVTIALPYAPLGDFSARIEEAGLTSGHSPDGSSI
ncbi:uncharacterized protein [Haliotis asinina]|uniref:uncharacterized protein n=1 Tax=Haliotis asinina TaxID=109174 RepID=UPI00353212BD